jgi:hypothetical protein
MVAEEKVEKAEKQPEQLSIQHSKILDKFHDKKYKSEYLFLQQHFINDLKELSMRLKGVQTQKRFDHLIIELDKMNTWIESNIQSMVQGQNEWKLSSVDKQKQLAV